MKDREALTVAQRELLESLLRDVGPRLSAYVSRAFGRRIDAEEIVAETFGRAADNIHFLEKADRPDLYLITMARNLCLAGFRRRRPEAIPDEQIRDLPARDERTPDQEFAEHEERRRLLDAVDRLPVAQKEVVVLRLTGEMKFEEIAELLDIPLGTALSRMNAAIGSLRKVLGVEHEPDRT